MTRVPLQPDGLDLLSGFRDFRSPVSLALRISDSRVPESLRMLDTCPLDQRPMMVSGTCISWFRIARDHVLEIPDMSNSDSPGSFAMCPYCLDGPDAIGNSRIAIPLCSGSTLLKSSMSEIPMSPRTPTRVLPRSTARTLPLHTRV
jgi:hypothetical protein